MMRVPGTNAASVMNLVSGERLESQVADEAIQFKVASAAMELNRYLIAGD